jgi:hypothetical protein
MISDPELRDFLRQFYDDNCVIMDEDVDLETALPRDRVELLASSLHRLISNKDQSGDPFLAPEIRDLIKMIRMIRNPKDAKRAVSAANTLIALIVKAQMT